jgi:hypothetical protein
VINGRDCRLWVKAGGEVIDVPYSVETIREAETGLGGCFVSSLSIETAPGLLGLAFGAVGEWAAVAEMRDLYCRELSVAGGDAGAGFGVRQWRGGDVREYEDCRIEGFELRIERGEAVRAKVEVCGGKRALHAMPVQQPPSPSPSPQGGGEKEEEMSYKKGNEGYEMEGKKRAVFRERFQGRGVAFWSGGREWRGIYAATISCRRVGEKVKTRVMIHRVLGMKGTACRAPTFGTPREIGAMEIRCRLFRDEYEAGQVGMFTIRLAGLALVSDETVVDSADAVIGPLLYGCEALGAVVYAKGKGHGAVDEKEVDVGDGTSALRAVA